MFRIFICVLRFRAQKITFLLPNISCVWVFFFLLVLVVVVEYVSYIRTIYKNDECVLHSTLSFAQRKKNPSFVYLVYYNSNSSRVLFFLVFIVLWISFCVCVHVRCIWFVVHHLDSLIKCMEFHVNRIDDPWKWCLSNLAKSTLLTGNFSLHITLCINGRDTE